jgi:thiol:disulfide interchange protein DsbD
MKFTRTLSLAAAVVLGLGISNANAAKRFNDVVKYQVAVEPAEAKRGETVTWKFTVDLIPGWHTYPTKQGEEAAASFVNSITFPDTSVFVPVGPLKEPKPIVKADPALQVLELRYYEGKVTWEQQFVVRPDARPGKQVLKAKLKVLACEERCLPPQRLEPEATITISDAPAVTVDPQFDEAVKKAMAAPAPAVTPRVDVNPPKVANDPPREIKPPEVKPGDLPRTSEEYKAGLEAVLTQLELVAAPKSSSGLLSFILSGIFWGAVSLVTPCVFPMIPITVSFFLKQSEKSHHRPIAMAVVYCSTIVVVLTLSAILLLSFFRMLSVNPVTNFVLGGLFIFFALSLFGMYEIELPSFLARYTSAREGQGGLAGTMFMALTFTIVSFACVAPFLGGFGGTAATSSMGWSERIFGGLAFSMTFAAPFFVLALFPSLLKKLPKSGSWLNSVKVVMGFLELAAAIKFFRAGEIVRPTPPSFFTYDFVLGLYIALAIICGLYLLGIFRLPHDTPTEHLGVPRMIVAMLFVALGIYLVPALFKTGDGEKQRPNGVVYAWIDSFLLPDDAKGLEWEGNLQQAIAEARAHQQQTGERQLIFVDFTGKSCTNCKYNEGAVFTKLDVKDNLRKYRRVQLYTDTVPLELYPPAVRERIGNGERPDDDAQANLWFQRSAFDTEQLPLYVILDPHASKVRVLGVYDEGKINNIAAFNDFLRRPLTQKTDVLATAEAALPR